MKYQRRISILLFVLVSLCLFLPSIGVLGQKNQDPILVYTVPGFLMGDVFILDEVIDPMPNGGAKIEQLLKIYWLSAPWDPFNPAVNVENTLGTSIQHVVGVERANGVQSLHGEGVFTSTILLKPGTITYTIGNNWNPNTGEMWAGRLRIVEGTDTFEGIKGPAELNFESMAFELYLHSNPWD